MKNMLRTIYVLHYVDKIVPLLSFYKDDYVIK